MDIETHNLSAELALWQRLTLCAFARMSCTAGIATT